MNCHRRSGRPSFPSAGDQLAGQEARLNAITAPGGTTYWSISFHLSLVRSSFVEAQSDEYAAYATVPAAKIAIIPVKNPKDFDSPLIKADNRLRMAVIIRVTGVY